VDGAADWARAMLPVRVKARAAETRMCFMGGAP
jgi:hypothetical protein